MSGQALRLAMTAVAGLHGAIEQATGLARRSGAAAVQWVSPVHASRVWTAECGGATPDD